MSRLHAVALAAPLILFSTLQCNAEGALALGKSPRGVSWFAIKWNANTIQEARNGALQSCLARGPNCSVMETFRSSCLAIVFGKRGDGASWYNWFVRPVGSAAQNLAMTACRNNGGYCELKGIYCDSVDETALAAQRLQEQQQAAAAAEQERAAAEAAAQRARADAEAELQRSQQAAQEAEQKRIAAEQATAAAEAKRNAAANSARESRESNIPAIPANDSILNKPLSQSWPLGLFLLLAFAATKEIWSARVPRQYKLLVTMGIAAFEFGLYAFTGINPADPQIVPLVSVNVPVVGVAVGFGFFVKIAHT